MKETAQNKNKKLKKQELEKKKVVKCLCNQRITGASQFILAFSEGCPNLITGLFNRV